MRVLIPALALISGLHAQAPPQRFQELKRGDRVFVKFESQGCFHHSIWELAFEKRDSISVSIKEVGPKKASSVESVLAEHEIIGLDHLLKFYRAKPQGGCTTIDTICVTWIRDGHSIFEEKFIDETCETVLPPGMSSQKSVTPFHALIQRILMEQAKHA